MDVYAALFWFMIYIGNFRFYSTRNLCDVRIWYLNLIMNDVFQTSMNEKQTELKNSIETLVVTVSDNPDSRYKDCRVIEMYNDMLKENFNFDPSASRNMQEYEVKETNDKLEDTNDNANGHVDMAEPIQIPNSENDNLAKLQEQPSSIDITDGHQQLDQKTDETISKTNTQANERLEFATETNTERSTESKHGDKLAAGSASGNEIDHEENDKTIVDDSEKQIDETEFIDETELLEDGEDDDEDEYYDEDEEDMEGENETILTNENSSNSEDSVDKVTFIDVSLNSCGELTRCNKVCYFLYSIRHCLEMYEFYNDADTNELFNSDKIVGKTIPDLDIRPTDIQHDNFMKDTLNDNMIKQQLDPNTKANKETDHLDELDRGTIGLKDIEQHSEEKVLSSNIDSDAELNLDDKEINNDNNKHDTVTETSRENFPNIDEIASDNFLKIQTKSTKTINDKPLENVNEHIKHETYKTGKSNNKEDELLGNPTPPVKETNDISLDELEKLIQLKTNDYANKIQSLELMIVNLEKQLLMEQLNKQNHSSTYTRLENIVLKLENDLLRMNKYYQNLKDETERIHQQQSQQLELTQKSVKSQNYLQLPDHSTEKFELISQHQAKIKELSEILQNQSEVVQKFKHRQDMLEEQNRMLHQMVMNQTIFMTSIIQTVQDLSEQNTRNKKEMSDMKEKIEDALKGAGKLEHTENLRSTDMLKTIDSYVSDNHLNLPHTDKGKPLQKGNALRNVEESSMLWCPLKRKTCPACFYQSNFIPDCLPYRVLVCIPYRSDCKHMKELLPRNPAVDDNSHKANTVDTTEDIENSNKKDMNDLKNLDMAIFEVNDDSNKNQDEMQEDTKTKIKTEPPSMNDKLDENIDKHTADDLNTKPPQNEAQYSHENSVATKGEVVEQALPQVGTNDKINPEQITKSVNTNDNIAPEHAEQPISTKSEVATDQTTQSVGTKDKGNAEKNTQSVNNNNEVATDKNTKLVDTNDNIAPEQTEQPVGTNGKVSDQTTHSVGTNDKGVPQQTIQSNDNNDNIASEQKIGTNGEVTTEQPIDSAPISDKVVTKQTIQSESVEDKVASEKNIHVPPSSAEEQQKQAPSDKSSSNKVDSEKPMQPLKDSSDKSSKDKIASEEKDVASEKLPTEQKAPTPAKKDKTKSKSKKSNNKGSSEEKQRKVPINLGKDTQKEPKDCYEIYLRGSKGDGIYKIRPQGSYKNVDVFCDMKKGGWTVIQRRQDGSTNFFLKWDDYKKGFGGQYGEHWIGNDVLHLLTNQDYYKLRVDLMDWDKNKRYADFGYFLVESESEGYRLHIEEYSGDAGDGLTKHNSQKFSTTDVDNDKVVKEFGGSCANRFHGAGWYYKCYASNLFGKYYKGGNIPEKQYDGITWKPWTGSNYSMKKVVMKIRPKSADDKS